MKIIKLGSFVKDFATGLKDKLTHMHPEDGQPAKGLWDDFQLEVVTDTTERNESQKERPSPISASRPR